MRTPARADHERSPTDTGIERAMNIENEFRTSPSQAAPDRRFYVDLSAQHEKVLLKEAKCHLKLNKQIQLELTSENFQQLIHLLAVSWSELTQSSKSHGLGKRGVLINNHGTVSMQPEKSLSDTCIQTQRNRRNEAAVLFKECISSMSQILDCKNDYEEDRIAKADTILRTVWEYATKRLQPIILGEAAVP